MSFDRRCSPHGRELSCLSMLRRRCDRARFQCCIFRRRRIGWFHRGAWPAFARMRHLDYSPSNGTATLLVPLLKIASVGVMSVTRQSRSAAAGWPASSRIGLSG